MKPKLLFLSVISLLSNYFANAQDDVKPLVDYYFCISGNPFSEEKTEKELETYLQHAKRIGHFLLNETEYSDDHGVMCQLGKIYFTMAEYDSAEIWYNNAYQLDSSRESYINNMGTVFYQNGKYDEALYYFNKVYQIDTFNLQYINNMASTYGMKKEYEKAYLWHKKSLQLGYEEQDLLVTYESLVKTCKNLGWESEAKLYEKKLKQFKKVRHKILKHKPVLCPIPKEELNKYKLN